MKIRADIAQWSRMSEPTGESPTSGSPNPQQGRVERERAWAAALARGDASVFESVFLTYHDRLHRFAQRFVGSPDVAEELVGNVFLRLWEQRAEREIRESLRSYLYTAVRNRALKYLQHRDLVRRVHDTATQAKRSPGMGQPPPSALEELQASELARAVLEAIDRLPERAREAYVLSRQHNLSYPEVAEVMGIHRKTVEIHIGRALKALREELAAFL